MAVNAYSSRSRVFFRTAFPSVPPFLRPVPPFDSVYAFEKVYVGHRNGSRRPSLFTCRVARVLYLSLVYTRVHVYTEPHAVHHAPPLLPP